MRKLLILVVIGLFMIGCGKQETRLDKIEAEQELQKHEKDRQPEQSQDIGVSEHNSVPQRGFDALKDVKEVRSEEHERQEQEQQLVNEADNQ
jgi:heat shock protein HslJ